MIYADFESILVPEDNKKENSDMKWRSDMNKYQEHIACSYGHKLYLLMIKLASVLSHTAVKMLFTILSIA